MVWLDGMTRGGEKRDRDKMEKGLKSVMDDADGNCINLLNKKTIK